MNNEFNNVRNIKVLEIGLMVKISTRCALAQRPCRRLLLHLLPLTARSGSISFYRTVRLSKQSEKTISIPA